MANVQTRIILRNDTLANWQSDSSLNLLTGEMAIATLPNGLAEIRIGQGGKWDTARKIYVAADQISGIVDTIKGNTNKYQVVAVDGQPNSWKLQSAPLSAADDEWSDVTGSTWSIDFDGLSNTISTTYATKQELSDAIDELDIETYALSADVDSLVSQVSVDTLDAAKGYTNEEIAKLSIGDYATKAEVNTVSTDLSTDYTGKINAVADTLNTVSTDYLKASDFNTISTTIGLDRANATNPVVTSSDIADITGAMHFRGVVEKQEGETDQQALARVIADPRAGDVALVGTAEYVYGGDPAEWKQFGDEGVYATVAYVDTQDDATYTSAVTDANAYADQQDAIVSAATRAEANSYTDDAVEALSDTISTDYATKTEVNDVSVALSTDYVGKIGNLSSEIYSELENYALSNNVTTLVSTTSAETLVSANAYTDEKVAALSIDDYIKHGEVVQNDLSGFFILDCGASVLRANEPTA